MKIILTNGSNRSNHFFTDLLFSDLNKLFQEECHLVHGQEYPKINASSTKTGLFRFGHMLVFIQQHHSFFFCSDFFSFAVVNFSLFVRQTSICSEYRIRVSNMSICIWTSERDLKNWISAFLLNLIDTKNIYSNSCIGCIWAFDRHETCTSQIIIIWYLGCTHEIGRYITLGRWALRMAMFYRLEHLTLNELG